MNRFGCKGGVQRQPSLVISAGILVSVTAHFQSLLEEKNTLIFFNAKLIDLKNPNQLLHARKTNQTVLSKLPIVDFCLRRVKVYVRPFEKDRRIFIFVGSQFVNGYIVTGYLTLNVNIAVHDIDIMMDNINNMKVCVCV
jgi:hypothetical protein